MIKRKCPDCPDIVLHQEHEHFAAASGPAFELTILKAKICIVIPSQTVGASERYGSQVQHILTYALDEYSPT